MTHLVGLNVESLLDMLAERVADRVAAKLAAAEREGDDWLDTRSAAAHLHVHADTLRKLAAANAIPSEQDRPRCKRFFRRSDLDAWRRADGRGASTPLPRLRNVP